MDAAVFLDLGDRLTKALTTRDFELYQQVISLPVELEPRGGTPYRLETVEELRQDFDLYCDHVALHSITDIFREVLDEEHPDPNSTIIVCRMHVLSGGTRVVRPFTTVITMRRDQDGAVRFARIQSSLGHINWTLGKGGIADGDFDLPTSPTDT
ncbi:hypothetical protein LZG00_14645 [Rhodobacteraceae bacterium LMO-12]|nr:hypothetical protein [Rhodobacteraceae bacterium LMO-JJ12]